MSSAVPVIAAKRDGAELTDEQIDWIIEGYARHVVSEEQMAALSMAIMLNGMTERETYRWTRALVACGHQLDLSGVGMPCVGKHSTGGVGDKVSLTLVPVVVACGVAVPHLAADGVGDSGSMLSKLGSIPGWKPSVSLSAITERLRAVGGIIGASDPHLTPTEARLSRLRERTGTVESIPLIAASIMSLHLAQGADAVVLDVKVGSGAVVKTRPAARDLAMAMVSLGTDAGVRTRALLTAMDRPLGLAVGNALEVAEAQQVLAGGGPRDVVDVTIGLAEEMLAIAGIDADPAATLLDGRAMDVWHRMIRSQGGDPEAPLPVAAESVSIISDKYGTVTALDADRVGRAATRLGAYAEVPGGPVSAGAGVQLQVGLGDRVAVGQTLATLYADDPATFESASDLVAGAIVVGGDPVEHLPLIMEKVSL